MTNMKNEPTVTITMEQAMAIFSYIQAISSLPSTDGIFDELTEQELKDVRQFCSMMQLYRNASYVKD